jgi:hypothetical protein
MPRDTNPDRVKVNEKLVPMQYPPFYDVQCNGVTIEWTDRHLEAHQVFTKSMSSHKELWKVNDRGERTLLNRR